MPKTFFKRLSSLLLTARKFYLGRYAEKIGITRVLLLRGVDVVIHHNKAVENDGL